MFNTAKIIYFVCCITAILRDYSDISESELDQLSKQYDIDVKTPTVACFTMMRKMIAAWQALAEKARDSGKQPQRFFFNELAMMFDWEHK